MLHARLYYAIHVHEAHIILLSSFSIFFWVGTSYEFHLLLLLTSHICLCFTAGVYPGFHPLLGLQYYTCGKLEWLESLLRFVSCYVHSKQILSLIIVQNALTDSSQQMFHNKGRSCGVLFEGCS